MDAEHGKVPDRLARLWAFWRSDYVTAHPGDRNESIPTAGTDRHDDSATGGTALPGDRCVFCDLSRQNLDPDTESSTPWVLHRSGGVFVVLNAYPYNPGHVMVVPDAHVDELRRLDPAVATHVWLVTRRSVDILQDSLSAEGINVGLNLGAASGAGIAEHLHVHIVPRWSGDTNFMTVAGANARVLPRALDDVYRELEPRFRRVLGSAADS